jgi:hypothetical protein
MTACSQSAAVRGYLEAQQEMVIDMAGVLLQLLSADAQVYQGDLMSHVRRYELVLVYGCQGADTSILLYIRSAA